MLTSIMQPRVTRACLPLDGETCLQDKYKMPESDVGEVDGLHPPRLLSSNDAVTGRDKGQLRKENKLRHHQSQLAQKATSQWSQYKGDFFIPNDLLPVGPHQNHMCPSGLARTHPAGDLLEEWATLGCPTMTGKPWTLAEIDKAIARGPHKSARLEAALAHFREEIEEKVWAGQAEVILWDNIRHNPPPQVKISPIAVVPHKPKAFRSILDLSFTLCLTTGSSIPSVNDTTTKTAPTAAVDQLGHALSRLIHAFAEADENDKIFMAKWDIRMVSGIWIVATGRSITLLMSCRNQRTSRSNLLFLPPSRWDG